MSIRTLEASIKALSNARRLAMLSYIKKQKTVTAGEVSHAVRLSMPAASQHLRILKSAGIIEYKRRGMFVTYRLSLKQQEPTKTVLAML